ncbi:MAG: hypothetical protein ACXABG_10625 [Promethearchaeota archaeon]|jgi:hypothetical protein
MNSEIIDQEKILDYEQYQEKIHSLQLLLEANFESLAKIRRVRAKLQENKLYSSRTIMV